MTQPNAYYNEAAMQAAVYAGRHRELVGGLWDVVGPLQLDFLVTQGLTPQHRLLDIGCGSLRLGALAIAYLESGCYAGVDLSPALLDAGYEQELDSALRARLPRGHLIASGDFNFSALPFQPDYAIAQSVFTHLPLNHLRGCLARLASAMTAGGRFYASYFECPPEAAVSEAQTHAGALGAVATTDLSDPYHYRFADLAWCAEQAGWRCRRIGDWGHPRGQLMAEFVRA